MLGKLANLEIKKGTRILVRSSLNVPIENGRIIDDSRLYHSAKTLNFLKEKGAKITVIAHLGREGKSLSIVSKELQRFTEHKFIGELFGENASKASENLGDGEVLLLENVRQDEREQENSKEFAELLSVYGDIFILDAFADAHRGHSSISCLSSLLPSYLGIRFEEEVETLRRSLKPERPSFCILGGAKLGTKTKLIIDLLEKYNKVFVGGVLANTLLSHKGIEVGKSIVGKGESNAKDYEYLVKHPNIILPKDVIVERNNETLNLNINEITTEDKIVDVGVGSIEDIKTDIKNSSSVLWNGPLGWYEKGFSIQSVALAKIIAESSAYSVVGGGDTIAILKDADVENGISFISTGGGAMLDFLSNNGKFKNLDIA